MSFQAICLAPILLQAAVLAVDEFYFHQRRGLGVWERWGHPVDTLSVLIPIAIAAGAPYEDRFIIWFSVLSLGSCVLVTKDEAVHLHEAAAAEHWLHAVLYLLHPVVFIAAAIFWYAGGVFERTVLFLQLAALIAFLSYQLVWWVLLRRGRWPS